MAASLVELEGSGHRALVAVVRGLGCSMAKESSHTRVRPTAPVLVRGLLTSGPPGRPPVYIL